MKSFGDRFNLKTDVRNYCQNTHNGNNGAQQTAVSVPERNKIGNTGDFIHPRNSDDFGNDVDPCRNNDHRTNVNGKIF